MFYETTDRKKQPYFWQIGKHSLQKQTLQVDLKGRAVVDQAKSLGLERNGILNESTNWAKHGGKSVCLKNKKWFCLDEISGGIYVTGEEAAKLTGQNVKGFVYRKDA